MLYTHKKIAHPLFIQCIGKHVSMMAVLFLNFPSNRCHQNNDKFNFYVCLMMVTFRQRRAKNILLHGAGILLYISKIYQNTKGYKNYIKRDTGY